MDIGPVSQVGPVFQRVVLEVLGSPSPKGSGRAILVNTSTGPVARFIPSSSSKNSQDRAAWESAIRTRARQVLGVRNEPVFVGVPVSIDVTFRMRRPGGQWGKKGLLPSAPPDVITSPDADKLLRSTLDALTGLVFDDDSRVCLIIARKVFASPGEEGARIIVAPRRDVVVHVEYAENTSGTASPAQCGELPLG